MSPHAATAQHVHDVLISAGLKPVHKVPTPTVPLHGAALIVGSPTLPEQVTATGCAPSEMICDVTIIAPGMSQTGIEALYTLTDQALGALLDAGAWNPTTTPTTWTAQDMQPVPAITLTVSVGYKEM